MGSLEACMRTWQDAGRIESYRVVDLGQHENLDELNLCQVVLEAGVTARLRRHDCFVAVGGERVNKLVSLVSTSFRRYTPAVHINCDLPSLVATLRSGSRVVLDDEPIATTKRDTHIVVDEDSIRSRATLNEDERASLLSLSLLDPRALDRLSALADANHAPETAALAARDEAFRAALYLCRRLGPGHEAWRIGAIALPLGTERRTPTERIHSLVLAAQEATRLGLFRRDALKRLQKLTCWLYPDLATVPQSATWSSAGYQSHGQVTVQQAGAASLPHWHQLNSSAHCSRSPAHGHHRSCSLVQFRAENVVKQAFKVEFRHGLLDHEHGGFEHVLPAGGRILAVVDAYSQDTVDRVQRCLDYYRSTGSISRHAIISMQISSLRKTFDHVLSIIRKAGELGLNKTDRIIAIGGGTIMDIVGYASFLYDGDTPYIRLPTTLVGMIDAGVGIKVGVNLVGKKNFVGAYHPPVACLCDTSFLRTLPLAELRCGASEAVKMGVISDAYLFEMIERHHAMILSGQDTPEMKGIIGRAVSAMLYELEPNPFERDLRRLPDFGHEFGHMLESLSQYQLRHGEAVSIGMAISCQLASYTGHLSRAELDRILAALSSIGLPIWDPTCDAEVLWMKLSDDVMPHKAGHLYLVVPTAIGSGDYIDSLDDISPVMLQRACAELKARAIKQHGYN
jgi:2-epi-5-epi-valiolone synthase